jgi:hypothetical protein
MYIGANQDSFEEGGSRGIKANYNFEATRGGTQKMSKVMSATLASYRSSVDFSPKLDEILKEESRKADLEDNK